MNNKAFLGSNGLNECLDTMIEISKRSLPSTYYCVAVHAMNMNVTRIKKELTDQTMTAFRKSNDINSPYNSFIRKCLLKVLETDVDIYIDDILTKNQKDICTNDNNSLYDYHKVLDVLTGDQYQTLKWIIFHKEYEQFDNNFTIYHVSHNLVNKIETTFNKYAKTNMSFENIFDGVTMETEKGKEYYIIPDQPFNETSVRNIKTEIYKKLLGGDNILA